jgi:EAL domain-containing protein (putative c-di-GMP-specific phosphodiesterase class I)
MQKRQRSGLAAFNELLHMRPGFLLTFSIAGLLAVALVAFAVSQILGAEIRDTQVTSATRSAELLSAASLGPQLPARGRPLEAEQLKKLDEATLAARRTTGLAGVGIWDLQSRIVYATDHRLIGTSVLRTPEAVAAFSGKTSTAVVSRAPSVVSTLAAKQIDVAVPIYAHGKRKPTAVAEVALPYAPVAQSVSTETQRIDLILIGASLLFYAMLWPGLLRASKAVRKQSDPRRKALLRELEHAFAHDELLLYYQPTINLEGGRVAGVEALLRWRHPKRGLLGPSEFLPGIVDSALNSRLALHVVEMALRDCGAWRDRGIDVSVNVNLSAPDVLDDALSQEIGKLLATAGIPPAALGLEVTEGAIVADPDRAAAMLTALDRLGVRVCINNFGTGYSSLAVLRDLPVTELKVDRSFISGLQSRPRDRTIVSLIIGLAHQLDVTVIAEGVEDLQTLTDLGEMHCDMAQGHYFSQPLPLTELVAWFETPLAAGYAPPAEPVAV